MVQQVGAKPSGPGPLIWVVIFLAAIAWGLWGFWAGIVAGLGSIALFVFIGYIQEQADRRKRASRAPQLTDDIRGVFDRMLSGSAHEGRSTGADGGPVSLHLPRNMLPPTGYQLQAGFAIQHMHLTIDSCDDESSKAAVLITRCFDNAMYCGVKGWSFRQASEAVQKVFGALIDEQKLAVMQGLAKEAVMLGYRTATPMDLEVIFGTKVDNSWRSALAELVSKARACVK